MQPMKGYKHANLIPPLAEPRSTAVEALLASCFSHAETVKLWKKSSCLGIGVLGDGLERTLKKRPRGEASSFMSWILGSMGGANYGGEVGPQTSPQILATPNSPSPELVSLGQTLVRATRIRKPACGTGGTDEMFPRIYFFFKLILLGVLPES